jgi:WD40 repeat protein
MTDDSDTRTANPVDSPESQALPGGHPAITDAADGPTGAGSASPMFAIGWTHTRAETLSRSAGATDGPEPDPTAPPGGGETQADEQTDPGDRPVASDAAARPPRFLGDYELLDEIARGGMGLVFRARQVHLGRIVALKLIRDSSLATYSELRRFRAEAEAIAQLDHPHIVPIYEVGQADDQPFFSMKLVEGGNLTRHVDRLKAAPRAAAQVMAKVARAVHYAHQRAILHRDLKPSNILLDERDEPFVTDFGLAKRIQAGGGGEQTVTGVVMGTPAYMPPEQARGGTKSVTTAADVYSLGATLYEILTGRPPFAAESVPELLRQVVEQEPARPRSLAPELDPDLETICLKCLEKDPARRYGSAEAVAEDLESWLQGKPIAARPAPRWERLVKWARRRPEIAGLVAAMVLLSLVGLGLVLWQWNSAVVANAGLRRSLYAAGMKLGEQAFANSQFPRVEALVKAHAADWDLQGFEWHYLRAVSDPELMTIETHHRMTTDVRLSPDPDGRLLATAGTEGTVRLWDSRTGSAEGTLSGHQGAVLCLAFHPRGDRLASGGHDRRVRVWDVATRDLVRTFEAPREVEAVAFSPDGRLLAGVCRDQSVVIADTERGMVQPPIKFPGTAPLEGGSSAAAFFDRDGKRLTVMFVSSEGNPAYVIDAANYRMMDKLTTTMDRVRPLSLENRDLYLGGPLSVRPIGIGPIDLATYSPVRRMSNDRIVVGAGDKHLVASMSSGVLIRIWNLDSGRELRSLQLKDMRDSSNSAGIDLSAEGRTLALMDPRRVYVWRNLLGEKSAKVSLGTDRLTTLALDPAGRVAAVGARDGTVTLWEMSTRGARLRWNGHKGSVYSVAFAPDGQTLASGGEDGWVRVWSSADRQLVHAVHGGPGQVFAVAFDPSGRRLIAGGDDRKLMTWDTTTWNVVRPMVEAHEGSVQGIAFSRDGDTLATAGSDQTIKLWDAGSGRYLRTLTPSRDANAVPTGPFLSVAFSPDGRRVVAACYDGTAVVWDARSGDVVHRLTGHGGQQLYQASFSPDGRRIITAGADRTVKLWDAVLGFETLELRHGAPVSAAAITPDGFRLLAAGWDGTLTLWDATPSSTTRKTQSRP